MNTPIIVIISILAFAVPAFASDGLVNVKSSNSVIATADKMETVLRDKGMTIFNRIKHSDGAGKVGIELRDTELIIFGNPKVGSPLMKCQQAVAIDLPQKALIWKDENGVVWISYNDPRFLEKRHGISGCEAVIAKIEKALAGIVKKSATR